MNTESTSRTDHRSESNHALKSHERRVRQSERSVTTREREAQGAHAPTQFTCFIVESKNKAVDHVLVMNLKDWIECSLQLNLILNFRFHLIRKQETHDNAKLESEQFGTGI
jgi:hypothetical protein